MNPRPPLPPAPKGVAWPTREWSTGALEPNAALAADRLVEALFASSSSADHGTTSALLVVQRGRLVCEHYGTEITASDTLGSWSVAKSVVHALTGLLIRDERIETGALAPVPEWHAPGDLRWGITIEHLLRMTDGLTFQEEWVEGRHNDVLDMLFQSGKEDVSAYARSRPGIHSPGSHWSYSSGTTNILTSILGEIVGGGQSGMQKFMYERLFSPLGITSAGPRFDAAQTFIGSSFVFMTARDLVRFGLFYLRDGVWEDERLLPEGWVDHARTPTRGSGGTYGAHWWIGRSGPDTFSAVGYEGQYLVLDPTRDLIVLRLGSSTPEQRERVEDQIRAFIADAPRVGATTE